MLRCTDGQLDTAIVVDDDELLRELLTGELQRLGIQVVAEASGGYEAVDLVEALQPALVCLDVEMPLGDGLEALARIRAMNPGVFVVMISSRDAPEDRDRAYRRGAHGYLGKPLNRRQLERELEGLGLSGNGAHNLIRSHIEPTASGPGQRH